MTTRADRTLCQAQLPKYTFSYTLQNIEGTDLPHLSGFHPVAGWEGGASHIQ